MTRSKPDEHRANERARKTAALIKGTMKMLGMRQQELAGATDRKEKTLPVTSGRYVTSTLPDGSSLNCWR